jgi:quercetin dioxygenase-like cupin family protein
MTLLADFGTDGSSLTSYRSQFAEGAVGAPAHFHTRASELFFVIGGSLQVLIGDEVKILDAGDLLLVPPHIPHAFAAARGAEADVLFVFTPGMPRDYLRLLGRVMRGEASPQEIKESSEHFDNRRTPAKGPASGRTTRATALPARSRPLGHHPPGPPQPAHQRPPTPAP